MDERENCNRLQQECKLLACRVRELFTEHDVPEELQMALRIWQKRVELRVAVQLQPATPEWAGGESPLKNARKLYQAALASLPPVVRVAYLQYAEIHELWTASDLGLENADIPGGLSGCH
jgi:hypothetical protein